MEQLLGVVAAMPEEVGPLLKRGENCRKERGQGYTLYRFSLGGRSIALVQSGMGPERAERGARALIAAAAPALLVSYGFGGAVREGLQAGDLVLAERLFWYREGALTQAGSSREELLLRTEKGCAGAPFGLYRGSFITGSEIVEKGKMARLVPEKVPHPVLEMESAAVLGVAQQAGIPFLGIRGISDAAAEELGFSLAEFTDRDLNIRLPRVLATVARKPWIIPQLLRLARNSSLAGKHLALCLELAAGSLPL